MRAAVQPQGPDTETRATPNPRYPSPLPPSTVLPERGGKDERRLPPLAGHAAGLSLLCGVRWGGQRGAAAAFQPAKKTMSGWPVNSPTHLVAQGASPTSLCESLTYGSQRRAWRPVRDAWGCVGDVVGGLRGRREGNLYIAREMEKRGWRDGSWCSNERTVSP